MTLPSQPHYSDNVSAFPMQGGCACGQIRYRINLEPLVVHCCHCTSCQRETGTAFAVNLVIESSKVTLLPPADAFIPASPDHPDVFLPANPPLVPTPKPQDVAAGVVQPEFIRTPSESGRGQVIARCPACRVAIWSEYSAGHLVKYIRVGTLDRAWLVAPDLHIFTRSRRTFISIEDEKPQFEEYYDREQFWRQGSLERYSALLPEITKYRESLGGNSK